MPDAGPCLLSVFCSLKSALCLPTTDIPLPLQLSQRFLKQFPASANRSRRFIMLFR